MDVREISLYEWIDTVGAKEIAKVLRIDISTVWIWRRGCNLPKDEHKLKIEKLTRGAVTAKRMIQDHFKPTNKKRWSRA